MTHFIEHRKQKRTHNQNVAVFYHANCSDGFGAAWAAWKKFGLRAEYVPLTHQTPPPQWLRKKEIYLLDICYPRKYLKKLMAHNKRVTAIDHHVSIRREVEMTRNYSYALEYSGAVLAWKYFHPKKPVPMLLRYIEDGDLWRFNLPHAREILAGLDLYDFEFKQWNKIAQEFENPRELKKYFDSGKVIDEYDKKLVERQVANDAQLVNLDGHKILAVNSPVLSSEICAALYRRKLPMSAVWYESSGRRKFSLRSDGSVDVSRIAAKFGGGGHRGSAGFSTDLKSKMPWRRITNN